MTVTKDAVADTLTRLAAGRGTLSAEELRQVVPVDAMSVEDIAALLAELDERGVTVDIDPALLSSRHPVSPGPRAAAAVPPRAETPPPAPPARPVAEMSGSGSGSAAASSAPAPAGPARQPSQRAVAIAVLAAAVVVVVLAALVWAF